MKNKVSCLAFIYDIYLYVLMNYKELHNLYSSPSIIRMIMSRRMRWAGHVGRMGEKRYAYMIFVGNPEGKRPPGRPTM
jgi:hypothetical protein